MKKIILYSVVVFSLLSCEDLLELTPKSNIVVENFYKNESDAQVAVNAVYSMLLSHHLYNQYNEVIQSQGTDDCEWGKGRTTINPGKNEMDKFIYSSASTLIYDYWVSSYKVINAANSVIIKVGEMDLTQEKKDQFVGEAQFLRGLIYFNLVRLFGDIPLVVNPTITLEGLEVTREPANIIYDAILKDFDDAANKLPFSYSGSNIGRATMGAALALKCKVYLTLNLYSDVVVTAELITAYKQYSLMNQYEEIFATENENGIESIFEIQYMISDEGSLGSSYAGFMAPPSQGGYGDNPVTKQMYDIYGEGDFRRDVNILKDDGAAASILEPYYVNKYDERGVLVTENGDNYIIIRYADVLLMEAEALIAIDENNDKAYELFNQIRRRAHGLPINLESEHDLMRGLTQEQFVDNILLERRKEFAFEGHRRFDLLRTGKLIEAMQVANPELTVMEKHLLFPIPQTERLANPNLSQNAGWE